ncbi:MAG: hypothetical protein ABIY70_20660 [Capsulimonas sp.]|uniref:hypothetical protein n=1 Tax=Capsulimonas sp. TaxID=2494211 RepID=UPI003264C105
MMKLLSIIAALLLVASVECLASSQVALPDRTAFARKMTLVHNGMSMAKLLKLLGPPDDIVRPEETDDRSYDVTWCYGASGHLTFPTLGYVSLRNGRVIGRINDDARFPSRMSAAPVSGLFSERQLRKLLSLIDRIREQTEPNNGLAYNPISMYGDIDGESYNPLIVIRIVNALQPLGKSKALAVLTEYCRLVPSSDIYVILRALFTDTSLKGMPYTEASGQRDRALILHGVPLIVLPPSQIGRLTTNIPAENQLAYARSHGVVRASALVPPNDPFEIPQEASSVYRSENYDNRQAWKGMIMNQIIRLVGSSETTRIWQNSQEREATDIVNKLRSMHLAWNARTNQYTNPKGVVIAPARPKEWLPILDGIYIKVGFTRNDATSIEVMVTYDTLGRKQAPSTIIVRDMISPQTVAQFHIPDLRMTEPANGSSSTMLEGTIKASAQTKLRITTIRQGKSKVSPVFTLP